MSLSSPNNKEMHDSTSGKLFGRSKTISHWAIPLSKDTPPIDDNFVCPRGSEVDFCLRAVSTHFKRLSLSTNSCPKGIISTAMSVLG